MLSSRYTITSVTRVRPQKPKLLFSSLQGLNSPEIELVTSGMIPQCSSAVLCKGSNYLTAGSSHAISCLSEHWGIISNPMAQIPYVNRPYIISYQIKSQPPS